MCVAERDVRATGAPAGRGAGGLSTPANKDPLLGTPDFGEVLVIVAGVECKAHYPVMDLPRSDDCFVRAFLAETTEAFLPTPRTWTCPCGLRLEGHLRAFEYFGAVPTRILYDNTKIAVAKILGGEQRQRTRAFL